MKAMITFAFILSISCLGASTAVYLTLNAEVERLEERLEFEKAANPAAEDAAPAGEVPDWAPLIEARLFTLEEKLGALERASVDRAPSRPMGGFPGSSPIPHLGGEDPTGAETPRSSGGVAEGKGDLEKKVKDLESKLGEVQKRLDQDKKEKKPKFDRFAAAIGLDEGQTEVTREILRRGKTELLEHLRKTLPTGPP